jgi:chromosome partitioning protein
VRTIAVINQKGGVGKTTTVANLGAAVADRGRSVCLIDLDPQAHLTLHFGVEPGGTERSMYDVLCGESKLAPVLLDVRPSVWLGPSSIDLAGAEIEMVNTVGREQILRDTLADADLPQDLVLIDCPPSLGLLTLNALAGADEVIIPLQPHFLALQGLGKLLETVSLVQRRINPKLTVSGVILCMYETTTRLAGEVRDDLRAFLDTARGSDTPWANTHIFHTFIRRNVKLAECPSYGSTIFDYDRSSHGAEDYAALADEFLSLRAPGEALPVRRQDVPQQYVPEWAAPPAGADAAGSTVSADGPAEPPA